MMKLNNMHFGQKMVINFVFQDRHAAAVNTAEKITQSKFKIVNDFVNCY